ncbi:MAG: M81 family metallopeptidase [Thermomicrobiales bacterium]
MMLRVAVAQMSHETNVFAAFPTTFSDFERAGIVFGIDCFTGAEGTNAAFGGFLAGASRENLELIPICSVWATPSGIVAADAAQRLTDILADGLRAAIVTGPIDGVLLALHGAMVTELDRDGDAHLLETARKIVGSDVPIVATLDLHANISERMVAAADVLIGYDTYPHVDMAARADEACTVLAQIVAGVISPTAALIKPPMMPTSQRMPTDNDPMRALIAKAHEFEEQSGVVNVTIAGGFPPSDVEECGFSVLVTTNNDQGRARDIANEIAKIAWDTKDGFLGGVTTFGEAATLLSTHESDRPLVIVDIGDNPWTGGPGDSSELLRFLLDLRIENAALALIRDPESVQKCLDAGPGSWVDLDLGAKTDRLHGESLRIHAYVRMIGNGRYVNDGPMMAGVPVLLETSAVIVAGPYAPERGISVLVTTRAETPIDLNVFRAHGIEPTKLGVIALKGKGHFRAAFEPIASQVVLVEGPGITGSELGRLPFSHIRRPIWPLDVVEWVPEP